MTLLTILQFLMKTSIFLGPLILLFLSFTNFVYGQVLGQDKDGFSSIQLPSANINLDFTNKVTTASFSQLLNYCKTSSELEEGVAWADYFIEKETLVLGKDKSEISKDIGNAFVNFKKSSKSTKRLLLGLELKGRSENGFSLILDEGLLATSASAIGTVGHYWKKKKYNSRKVKEFVDKRMKVINSNLKNEEFENDITLIVKKMIASGVVTKSMGNNYFLGFMGKYPEDKIEILEDLLEDYWSFGQVADNKLRSGELKVQKGVLKSILGNVNKTLEDFPDSLEKNILEKEEKSKELFKKKEQISLQINQLSGKHAKFEKLELELDLDSFLEKSIWETAKEKLEYKLVEISVKIEFLKNTSGKTNNLKKELKKELEEYLKHLNSNKEFHKKDRRVLGTIVDYEKHIIYGRAGFTGTSFRFDLDNGASTLAERIVTRDFQGTRFEIGWTYQLKSVNYFGVNLSKEYRDNSDALQSTTVKFTTIDNTVNPVLQIETELNVLSEKEDSPYEKFDQYQLSLDYARMVPLRDLSKSKNEEDITKMYAVINPYLRHRFYYNSLNQKPNSALGLGVFAFNVDKNSIAGGFFVQADDIFNVLEDSPNQFTNKISIGLVFKYALNSFNPKK